MKINIHPTYNKIIATCSCNNIIEINSTLESNINLDVCNNCHPFYTGKQRIMNVKGRVNKFNKYFNFTKNIK